MGFLSIFQQRSKDDNITNPCPVPQPEGETTLAEALDEYRKNKVIPMMNLSTFFAAINLVSNSVALMNWIFKDENNKKIPKSHYLYHLFDESEITRFNIVKNVMQDIIRYGNGFIYIERDKETGRPRTLHYSPAYQTALYLDEIYHKVYYYNFAFSDKIDDGTNFLHFYTNTEDGYIGKGVLKYAYNVINIASTIQEATDTYYSTTGQQFGIVSPNGSLPEIGNKQKQLNDLRAKWNEVRNKSNKGTIFFPSDLKFTPMTSTAKDSSLIEAREYNAVETGRFVANLSPILLGDLRHNVYGQLSEAQKEFVIHSLAPYVTMWEEQCNKKLIMPSKWGKQFIDLDENSILANDTEKTANTFTKYTNAGVMARNEVREELGLPPVEGGDVLAVPYSNVEDNTIGNTEKTTEEEDEKQ